MRRYAQAVKIPGWFYGPSHRMGPIRTSQRPWYLNPEQLDDDGKQKPWLVEPDEDQVRLHACILTRLHACLQQPLTYV